MGEGALRSAHSIADDAIKKKISALEAKLNQLKSRQMLLRQKYTAAKKKKDRHTMIKLGTEERDNSVHEKKITTSIKELRSKQQAQDKMPETPAELKLAT